MGGGSLAGTIMTATGLRSPARPGALTRFLHRHEGWRGHLLLAPALLVMAAAILFPLGMTLTMSTWSLSGYDIQHDPGIGNYVAMTENPMFRVLILRTLTVAATCTLITVILSIDGLFRPPPPWPSTRATRRSG